MSSLTRLICAACAAATVALLVAAPGGSAATPLKSCSLTVLASEHLGATYVTELKVGGPTCSAGTVVAKAFNKCRREKGLKGHCTHKAEGYACTETRPADQQIPTQVNGVVKCKRAAKRVNFHYQQNT